MKPRRPVRRLLFGATVLVVAACALPTVVPNGQEPSSPCLACHPEEGGRMVGFLEGVSFRSKRLLLDRITGKEVVAFDEGTVLNGVGELADLADELEGRIALRAEIRGGELIARQITVPPAAVEALPEHDLAAFGGRPGGARSDGTLSIEAFQWSAGRPPGTLVILDVRTDGEYVRSHVPGALHIPLDELAARKRELPKDRRILIYCARGVRAKMAYVLLNRYGYDVRYLDACFRPEPEGGYRIEPKEE